MAAFGVWAVRSDGKERSRQTREEAVLVIQGSDASITREGEMEKDQTESSFEYGKQQVLHLNWK